MHVSRMNGMRWIRTLLMATAWLLAVAIPVPLHAEAIPVELVQLENGVGNSCEAASPTLSRARAGAAPRISWPNAAPIPSAPGVWDRTWEINWTRRTAWASR